MKQLLSILLLASSTLVFGQYHTGASRSELGVLVGGTYYLGDLNQFSQFRNTHLAGGLIYRYNVNPRLSVRANFTYGKVSAEDSKAKNDFQKERNLSFYSNIYELGAGFEFNYFPFQLGHKRYKGTAYLLAELGVFRMNPKTNYNGAEVELRNLGTEGQGTSLNSKGYYNLTQVCIPLGVGVKLSLGNRMGVNFEFGIRKTFTDYLDDVKSDSYVDPLALAAENGPLSAELSNLSGNRYGQRGNSSTKDWYVFSGMMVTIRLGSPAKCYDH
ncbi:MAG: DUF6089 family protein [Crocinitomicaceae bacterium]